MAKRVDVQYWRARKELREVLNQPLAGGRGFQVDQDKRVKTLCEEIAGYELPPR